MTCRCLSCWLFCCVWNLFPLDCVFLLQNQSHFPLFSFISDWLKSVNTMLPRDWKRRPREQRGKPMFVVFDVCFSCHLVFLVRFVNPQFCQCFQFYTSTFIGLSFELFVCVYVIPYCELVTTVVDWMTAMKVSFWFFFVGSNVECFYAIIQSFILILYDDCISFWFKHLLYFCLFDCCVLFCFWFLGVFLTIFDHFLSLFFPSSPSLNFWRNPVRRGRSARQRAPKTAAAAETTRRRTVSLWACLLCFQCLLTVYFSAFIVCQIEKVQPTLQGVTK